MKKKRLRLAPQSFVFLTIDFYLQPFQKFKDYVRSGQVTRSGKVTLTPNKFEMMPCRHFIRDQYENVMTMLGHQFLHNLYLEI